MLRLVILFVVTLFSLFFLSNQAQALENFNTFYDVTYTIGSNGLTHVVFKVDIQNKSGQFFAPSYKVRVGFKNIQNVKVRDKTTEYDPNIEQDGNGNSIAIVFAKKVVGRGKTNSFTIEFDTDEVARKMGNVWEINIPGLLKESDFKKFDVHIVVPSSFKSPSYIKPQPTNIQNNKYSFSYDKIKKSGISLAFGQEQLYDFSLLYHIKNINLFPIHTEIALPMDTNYQQVMLDEIKPKPENIFRDKDGNWLAQYYLLPQEKKDIKVKGKVKIALTPKKEDLSDYDFSQYLKERPYWETSNEKIKSLAKKLKTPEAIYNYVIDNLTYDFTRVTTEKKRVGALVIFQNPKSAVCLEFTDLFIALSRAAGIPAREVDGFAYTNNEVQRPVPFTKDVLHAWPEYYDQAKKTWIMIDPTWANTTGGIDYFHTLDYDHIAFVIKGRDSVYPVPAGGYKLSKNENTKDIIITPSIVSFNHLPKIALSSQMPSQVIAGLPLWGTVTIKNLGKTSIPAQNIRVESDFMNPKFQNIYFPEIPPLGSSAVKIQFEPLSFLTNKEANITITLYDGKLIQILKVVPFFKTRWLIIGGVIIGIFIIGLFIVASRARHLFFPR